jgi:hypothetical protein
MHTAKTILCIFAATFALAFQAHAQVEVDVKLSPAGSFKAQTSDVSGFAYKTKDGIAAENVLIDLRNISTGIALRDKHTKEHLLVEKFPKAKLVKAVGKDGKGTARISIKGVEKEYAGTYKVEGDKVIATFPVHLPDLKIEGVRYMGVGVKDEVNVKIELPLKAGPAVKRATASTKKKK